MIEEFENEFRDANALRKKNYALAEIDFKPQSVIDSFRRPAYHPFAFYKSAATQ